MSDETNAADQAEPTTTPPAAADDATPEPPVPPLEFTPPPFKSDKAANIAVAKEWLAAGQSPLWVAGWLADTCPDHFADVTAAEKELGL